MRNGLYEYIYPIAISLLNEGTCESCFNDFFTFSLERFTSRKLQLNVFGSCSEMPPPWRGAAPLTLALCWATPQKTSLPIGAFFHLHPTHSDLPPAFASSSHTTSKKTQFLFVILRAPRPQPWRANSSSAETSKCSLASPSIRQICTQQTDVDADIGTAR